MSVTDRTDLPVEAKLADDGDHGRLEGALFKGASWPLPQPVSRPGYGRRGQRARHARQRI